MKNILPTLLIASMAICINACSSSKQAGARPRTQGVTNSKIVLTTGQKITAVSSTSSDIDMGMGQMKSSNSSTNILNVLAADSSNYKIINTLTKISMTSDMMGQQNNYDSEKPEDKDSEIGKMISSKLNISDTARVDNMTGVIAKTNASPEKEEKKDDSNPFAGMIEAMGANAGTNPALEGAFFVIPQDKKTGDTWADSSSQGKIKNLKTYTLTSIENNVANISMATTVTGSGESEMQGNNISFTLNSKGTGQLIVDTKTGLVKKISNDADLNMTMDVMGQSIPMTGKTTTTITYQ